MVGWLVFLERLSHSSRKFSFQRSEEIVQFCFFVFLVTNLSCYDYVLSLNNYFLRGANCLGVYAVQRLGMTVLSDEKFARTIHCVANIAVEIRSFSFSGAIWTVAAKLQSRITYVLSAFWF